MSIQMNGTDIAEIVGIVTTVGSILATMIAGLIFYLMVRPPRNGRRQRPEREERPGELDEMWRLMDRMDSRLEVLERALAAEERAPIARRPRAGHEDRLLSPAVEGRESGGMK